MALSFPDAQEAVIARLRATDIPNVFEAVVPPGFVLPQQNGAHLPYACISFGGKTPVAIRNQSIDTSKNHLKRTAVTVECIGDSPGDVRKVAEIVRGALEGYEVDESWSELTELLAGDYTMYAPDYDLWPVRYATGIHYTAFVGAVTA